MDFQWGASFWSTKYARFMGIEGSPWNPIRHSTEREIKPGANAALWSAKQPPLDCLAPRMPELNRVRNSNKTGYTLWLRLFHGQSIGLLDMMSGLLSPIVHGKSAADCYVHTATRSSLQYPVRL